MSAAEIGEAERRLRDATMALRYAPNRVAKIELRRVVDERRHALQEARKWERRGRG